MKALNQNEPTLIEDNLRIVNDEINTIKKIIPEIVRFKNRFYLNYESEILNLKEKITNQKALSKVVFSESKNQLKRLKANYKTDLDQIKIDHNYELYELKENRKMSLQKMKASSKNYLNEIDTKIDTLNIHINMLRKNRDPKTIVEIDDLDTKVDRLVLSNESIKQNYKTSKIRENALMQNSGVKFLERRKKMKHIKEELRAKRDNDLEKNNQAIIELENIKSELKNKTVSNQDAIISQINNDLEQLKKDKNDFIIEFDKFYLKEEENINRVYEQDVKDASEVIQVNISNLKEAYFNKREEMLKVNSKDNLKQKKIIYQQNYKKYQKELKGIYNKIKEEKIAHKIETKEYITKHKIIRQDAKDNIKIIKKQLKSELSKKDINSEEKNNLEIVIEHLENDIKSMNKVITEQRKTRMFKNINTAYFFISPAVFGALVFTILPLIFMLIVAFFKLDIVNLGKSQFVGFNNFYEIFKYDIQFRQSLTNTLIYALITIGLLSVVTLSMAAWLSKNTRIHNAVTTMVFTPHIASLVAISILWIALLSPTGLINQLLAFFGIEGPRWLLQENTSLLSVSMVTVWKDIGYYVLLIIAGLQAIPSYVYEAAKLDKSSKVKTFFRVTVPLLAPTLSFVFVNKFINSFKVFAPIEIMTNGGPMGSSTVLSYWIYKVGRLGFNYGQAMSGAIILTLIITFFTIINFRFFNRKIEY